MAFTAWGFDGTVHTESEFTRMLAAAGRAKSDEAAVSGFALAPGAGVRQSVISAGTLFLGGLLVDNDADVTVAHDENATGATVVDHVVMKGNWGDNSIVSEVRRLAPGATPDLTKAAGSLWEAVVGRVTVPNAHAATFSAAQVESCPPLPREVRSFSLTGWEAADFGNGITGGVLASVTIPDPGYPFRLVVVSSQMHAAAGSGRVAFDVDANGTYFARGLSRTFQVGEYVQPITTGGRSGVLTGKQLVRARVSGIGIAAGVIAVQNPGYSHCTIEQIPA